MEVAWSRPCFQFQFRTPTFTGLVGGPDTRPPASPMTRSSAAVFALTSNLQEWIIKNLLSSSRRVDSERCKAGDLLLQVFTASSKVTLSAVTPTGADSSHPAAWVVDGDRNSPLFSSVGSFRALWRMAAFMCTWGLLRFKARSAGASMV